MAVHRRGGSVSAARAGSIMFNYVRQINHDAVPPVEVNPATISAAKLSPGWKRNGHAMGVAIT